MKKLVLYISIIFLCFTGVVHAHPVTEQQAKYVAINWIMEKWGRPLTKMKAGGEALALAEENSAYYIFNLPGGGWMILSADDVAHPVIAYSYTGKYSQENHPVQFDEWMAGVKQEIDQAAQQSLQPSGKTKQLWDNYALDPKEFSPKPLKKSAMAPMLTTTWGQGRYYNASCPWDSEGIDGHTLVGCVAVAMAQVMKYHNYPARGHGSHTDYDPVYGALTVNFSATSYNWASMPDYLLSYNNAVSTLMYHVGVSVDMEYSATQGSAASSEKIAYALKNFFKYNPNIYYAHRSSYSTETWESLLRKELNNHRPVIYGGYGTGGHQFVCDGYENDDFFHFNWGWNGQYQSIDESYHYLGDITPGPDNYTYNQDAVFGIEPIDKYEPDNYAGQARYIQFNQTQTHSIDPANDVDWVRFSITSPKCVTINTSGLGSADTRVWLYNNNMQQIAFDDDSGQGLFSEITMSLSAPGTYYIKVDEYENNNIIDAYTLSLKSCDSAWTLFMPAILSAASGRPSPGSSCGPGKIYDCHLQCVSSSTAQSWIGDGYCDNGTYGMYLNCPAFQYDGGDCN